MKGQKSKEHFPFLVLAQSERLGKKMRKKHSDMQKWKRDQVLRMHKINAERFERTTEFMGNLIAI